ncbi:NAD(P)-binding protein [Coprinellus micaceus]|uniref:NAD(P)-binding protein n=1 Tax=Coprinellus micaceus TaxID=71717 RepID=A0A4Y7T4T1_COPMI|nr:NAD(P)-binding protein [Coprinellus micaceus]
MPALSSPTSKVLVTGPNGYIGLWVVKTLLDRGHTVRAAVRSETRAKDLKTLFSSAGNRLEFAIVEDMLKEGAFDEAVKGVDAIQHLASPIVGKAQTNEEYIRSAVDGTLEIFKSALKNGSTVKRIVTTSSTVAVWSVYDQEVKTFTELDWNEQDVAWVKDETKSFDHIAAYSASKTLAERAAWDFYNTHKQEVKWDIAFVLPSMVYGPSVHSYASPAELTGTQKTWWDGVVGEGKTKETLSQGANWVDVRDVAEAQVRALEREDAGNERFLVVAESYVWQEWLDLSNSALASLSPGSATRFSQGFSDIKNQVPTTFDTSKVKRILGITYRTKEETTKDVLAQAVKLGWI